MSKLSRLHRVAFPLRPLQPAAIPFASGDRLPALDTPDLDMRDARCVCGVRVSRHFADGRDGTRLSCENAQRRWGFA